MLSEEELKKVIKELFYKHYGKGDEFKVFTNDIRTVEMFNEALKLETERLNIKVDDKEKT